MPEHVANRLGKISPYMGRIVKIGGATFAAVLIFFLGIAVGNGQISFASANSQNKSLPSQLDYRSVNLYTALSATITTASSPNNSCSMG